MKKPATGHIELAACDGTTMFVRVIGQGSAANCSFFRDLADSLLERGYNRFVVDLSQCEWIDSTFMGALVGLTLAMQPGVEPATIQIVNAQGTVIRALDHLGLRSILNIVKLPVRPPIGTFERIAPRVLEADERVKMIRKAHEHLCAVTEENRSRFAPFLEALAASGNPS
jgi:anti-anti-sigma factor